VRKPASEWDEDYVLSLPLEDDTLERKGSALLDLTLPKVNEDAVRDELAKQLSAFANTGGGVIIYGVTDAGKVDQGGISRSVKGRQATKEWLEDLIPILTDYEILGVNVYEIAPKDQNSSISSTKALYVVNVPDSERAPHQSKRDFKYYVRLGGRSQPASHRLIEDIRNRARHPILELSAVEISRVSLPGENLPRLMGRMGLRFRLVLTNRGSMKASNACVFVAIQSPDLFVGDYDNGLVKPRRTKEPNAVFWEALDPIYPAMAFSFWFEITLAAELQPFVPPVSQVMWVSHGTGRNLLDLSFSWRIYADNAPAKEGETTLRDLDLAQKARYAIEESTLRDAILNYYGSVLP